MPATEFEALELGELLAGFADAGAAAQTPVAGLSLDSRQVRPGSVFAALVGHVDRGSDFVADALE
ncbi:MAG: UDP-N-acetylmuramoyl-L-alanyl-D-glutamate--2,6-diaminopimelate ligase, partial [Gammaproteobacteria bacterium]|nr:UDP-N-acetylmuramoyl-L-alanyl-D-glutamate--2,6-diaminopimelate ligase [Gammaproteobacteria bacterium]